MRKRIVIAAVTIAFVVVLLAGCGLGDETISLVGGYEIWQDGDYSILVKIDGDQQSTVVNEVYIVEYALSNGYIAIAGVPVGYDRTQTAVRGYYLVNTESHEIYGMFDSGYQLQEQCAVLGISDTWDWTSVT